MPPSRVLGKTPFCHENCGDLSRSPEGAKAWRGGGVILVVCGLKKEIKAIMLPLFESPYFNLTGWNTPENKLF